MIFVYLFSLLIIETISYNVCPWDRWPTLLSDCDMDKLNCKTQVWDSNKESCCTKIASDRCKDWKNVGSDWICHDSYCGGCWAVWTFSDGKTVIARTNVDENDCEDSGLFYLIHITYFYFYCGFY